MARPSETAKDDKKEDCANRIVVLMVASCMMSLSDLPLSVLFSRQNKNLGIPFLTLALLISL